MKSVVYHSRSPSLFIALWSRIQFNMKTFKITSTSLMIFKDEDLKDEYMLLHKNVYL